jgi:hypothetical protein
MQLHVNNPALTTGVPIPNVGLRLHTTTTLRQHTVGVMELSDPTVSYSEEGAIKPVTPRVNYEGTCRRECTYYMAATSVNDGSPFTVQTVGANYKIHMFGSFMHMHAYGREMWTKLYRYDGNGLGDNLLSTTVVEARQFWNNGFQVHRI